MTTSFPRLMLLAGLLWAATPRTFVPFQVTSALGRTRRFAEAKPRSFTPYRAASKTRRFAAATLPEAYWASANTGLLCPEDFLRQHVGKNIPEVIRTHLAVMLQRATGGFAAAWDCAQNANLRLFTPASPYTLPSAETYLFKAEGDPMITVYDKHGKLIRSHHYYGPAVMLFFDEYGHLKHIDFVGVCDRWGENRQSPQADYVGEHARLHVQTGKWKYRNGCGRSIAQVSDCEWESEMPESWQPDLKFLNPFKGGKTFVLHAYQPRVIEGPLFDEIWSMATAPELFQLDFDRSMANDWVNAMLVVVGSAQRQGFMPDAKEVLRYAVMYGMAMTNAGQHLPVLAPS